MNNCHTRMQWKGFNKMTLHYVCLGKYPHISPPPPIVTAFIRAAKLFGNKMKEATENGSRSGDCALGVQRTRLRNTCKAMTSPLSVQPDSWQWGKPHRKRREGLQTIYSFRSGMLFCFSLEIPKQLAKKVRWNHKLQPPKCTKTLSCRRVEEAETMSDLHRTFCNNNVLHNWRRRRGGEETTLSW